MSPVNKLVTQPFLIHVTGRVHMALSCRRKERLKSQRAAVHTEEQGRTNPVSYRCYSLRSRKTSSTAKVLGKQPMPEHYFFFLMK